MASSFNSKQSFGEKIKDEKTRRSYILTAVALGLALVIITVTAIIANRSKDPVEPVIKETEKSTLEPDETEKSTETEGQKETEKQTQKPSGNSSSASSGLPSFTLPVSGTLTNKHDPELQVFSPTMNDYRVHLGIDIQTAENAPVYASADGKISKIWVDTLMGYCLAVEHSGDCVTIYKNLGATLPEHTYGWSGAYGTHFWVDPDNKVIGIYMKNSRWYDSRGCGKTGKDFERAVVDSFE